MRNVSLIRTFVNPAFDVIEDANNMHEFSKIETPKRNSECIDGQKCVMRFKVCTGLIIISNSLEEWPPCCGDYRH